MPESSPATPFTATGTQRENAAVVGVRVVVTVPAVAVAVTVPAVPVTVGVVVVVAVGVVVGVDVCAKPGATLGGIADSRTLVKSPKASRFMKPPRQEGRSCRPSLKV